MTFLLPPGIKGLTDIASVLPRVTVLLHWRNRLAFYNVFQDLMLLSVTSDLFFSNRKIDTYSLLHILALYLHKLLYLHCVKYRNFTRIPGLETLPFCKIATPGNRVKFRYFTQCYLIKVEIIRETLTHFSPM